MTMESLPTILFQVRGDDVGDLEYIQGFVTSGNYRQISGDINTLNDTIEFIVPNGKTAFMIEAKITFNTITNAVSAQGTVTNASNNQVIADLIIDTVPKSKTMIGVSSAAGSNGTGGGQGGAGSGFGVNPNGKFNVLGLSLVGDGVKKIEIENVLDAGSAFAEMSLYLIDT